MSLPRNCVFVNNFGLGKTPKSLLIAQINNHFSDKLSVVLASEVDLEIPATWRVKLAVAQPLAAKLWLIRNKLAAEKSLYLDGNLFIQGDLSEIFQQESEACLQASQKQSFGYLRLFVVNYPAVESENLAQKLSEKAELGYGNLADFDQFHFSLLSPDWSIVSYGENPEAKVIDCLPLESRPWYSCFAPNGKEWSSLLFGAIKQGYLSWESIQEDVNEGLVRPSLLNQLELEFENPLALSEEVFLLDRGFIPPELAVSEEQIQVLNSTIFELPKKRWLKVIFSRYLIEQKLPRWRRVLIPAIKHKIKQFLGIVE